MNIQEHRKKETDELAYQPLLSLWFHLKFVVLARIEDIIQALCFHLGWSRPEMLATVGKREILRFSFNFPY